MKRKSLTIGVIAAALVGNTIAAAISAQEARRKETQQQHQHSGTTDENARIPSGETAEGQSSSASAIETTRRIREAITARDDLSVNAQNIKIVTDASGKVTLRGPVNSEKEKRAVIDTATAVVGKDKLQAKIDVVTRQG